MPAPDYLEWQAFDAIEPLDAAGVILKGLSGGKEHPSQPQAQAKPSAHWMNQKMQMLTWFNRFGKKK